MIDETQDFAGATDVEQRPEPPLEPAVTDASDAPRPVRWNVARDASAAVLLVVALTVPWNVSFGLGLPNHTWWLYAVVVGATLLALVALAASNGGPLSESESIDKVRLGLTAPYLLVLLGFVGFAVYDFVVLSGGGTTPPGVGPGVLVGAAGACLTAQPVLTGAADRPRFVGWFVFASRFASWAKFFVAVAVLLTLYLRVRDVVPNVFDSAVAWPSIVTVATALAYGAVAVAAVWIGLRWMQQEEMDAGLATIALGAATVVGSLLVWFMPLGRDVDAFHGIAQATSTAGVGYEGYLAWAVGAAIFAPAILWQTFSAQSVQANAWHEAARKCLLLIAVWCAGSAVLRIFDVIAELASGLPVSPSDTAALFVFDLVTAGFAFFLRANFATAAEHRAAVSRLSAVLFVLLVCRVAIGVGLARPIAYAAPQQSADAVYGNTLAHQLTSTFDVVLALLALAVLAAALILPGRRGEGVPADVVEPVAAPAKRAVAAKAAPAAPAPVAAEPTPVAPTRPTVPFWQAPSQWGPPAPHEGGAGEPVSEPVWEDPIEVDPPAAEPAWPPPEQSRDVPAPEDQQEQTDESDDEATTSANSGRHRHRLPSTSADAEE